MDGTDPADSAQQQLNDRFEELNSIKLKRTLTRTEAFELCNLKRRKKRGRGRKRYGAPLPKGNGPVGPCWARR